MWAWNNILFYIIFLGQILLVSWYLPNQILARMKHALTACPPSEYPKLYPRPLEYYLLTQWKFRAISRAIFGLGVLALILIIFGVDHANFADDGYISEAWPMAYGLLQFIPFILLELSEMSQLRLMRKANHSTVRKAELRPRRLFEIVSPGLVAAAGALFVMAVVFDLWVHDFVIDLGHDTMQRALTMAATNLLLVLILALNLLGRKKNPHQAAQDRTRHLSTVFRSLMYVSMALSVFIMTAAADDVFALDFLDASILSLYFQVIAYFSIGHVLRSLHLQDINFEVYRADLPVA